MLQKVGQRGGSSSGQIRIEDSRKDKGWEIIFGGEGDDEYRSSGVLWSDNQWIFSGCPKEKLT